MYKYAVVKEDTKQDTRMRADVGVEKNGVYCDLCGELMDEPLYHTRRNHTRVPLNTIVPKIQIHSIIAHRDIDVCPKCASELLNKISIHSGSLMESLLETSDYEILHHEEDVVRTREDLAVMRDIANALSRNE